MKNFAKQALFWTPRILVLLFAAFVSVFALDVFVEGEDTWRTLLDFLIHLLPTGIILGALLIAWRWEGIGGLLFIGLGALFLVRTKLGWFTTALFLAGTLFLLNWLFQRTKSDQQQTYGNTL